MTGAVPEQRLTLAEITNAAAILFDVSIEELKASTRVHRIAHPRQVAMAVCRELTDASYPKIARHFGGRDHTTILFAFEKIARGELAEQAGRLRTFLARGDVRSHLAAARERKRLEAIEAAEREAAERLLRSLTAATHRAKLDAGFYAADRFGRRM